MKGKEGYGFVLTQQQSNVQYKSYMRRMTVFFFILFTPIRPVKVARFLLAFLSCLKFLLSCDVFLSDLFMLYIYIIC